MSDTKQGSPFRFFQKQHNNQYMDCWHELRGFQLDYKKLSQEDLAKLMRKVADELDPPEK